jgi:CheY-like chemotaxis protein
MELMLANVKIRTVCERAIAEAKAIHVQNRRNTFSCATPMSPAKEHQFSLVIEPGLEDIIADEFRLRQMLVHLISNALKFTETGGEIGVRVNRWEGWIAFTVWDTGIGIPEHQQHLIFQKFQQLENPLTRKFEGTGLGLVLTRALARLHGGDVSFLSREGQGSQFTLLLPPTPPQRILGTEENKEMGANSNCYPYPGTTPLAACSSQELVSNSSSPAYRNNLVLVVEAVARYIEDLTEMLTGLGYRVVIARSGCEAVEKARRLQPKAIFLNPLLPLLSGWDVLTLLKSDPATRSIPVIVTATGAEKEQAIAHCADGFLSLPLQEQILAPILENLCHTPEKKQQTITNETFFPHTPPLRILRLIDSETDLLDSHRFLQQHRVIEVNDIEQAEILARVWQFDVVLLDVQMPAAETYLQQIKANPRLASLPLVTRDVATTQAASQIPGLSVFPCLTKHNADPANNDKKTHALLSVLQIAAGMCCPPCVLVVDLATLPELAESRRKTAQRCRPVKDCSLSNLALEQKASVLKSPTLSGGSEWFQALIQYLQTAGLKATMSRSWTELLQQLRHESVDLLLICLGETKLRKEVLSALQTLEQLPFKLPPVLVLDRRLHSDVSCKGVPDKMLGAIACQILPRSTSMEDLLKHIHQALTAKTQQLV